MARLLSSMALVVALLVVSQPSAAGTITSVYSLDPGGILTFEAIGEDFTITGGSVKVAYDAKGPQTPALGSPSGFLLSATLSFSGTESGKIVLLPSSGPFALSDISGGVGFVTLFAGGWKASGTFGGDDLTGTITDFTLYASLPALPTLGSLSLYLDGTGNILNTIYLSFGNLSGQEISRTFVPEPSSGLLVAMGVTALPAIGAVVRRRRS